MDDRRNFISKMAAGMAVVSVNPMIPKTDQKFEKEISNVFVHHVFFWLKEPKNTTARADFEKGIRELVKVPQIQNFHISTPVESSREVVDDSFTYSYLAFFKNSDDQTIYQTHPIHLKFIEDCQHLWEKVIVYDSMD